MEVTNRFKGLDVTDRVSEELRVEVHDIVQEVVIKIIPKKKKSKKDKWFSEEALQIAEKRRETRGKGEKKDINIWDLQGSSKSETFILSGSRIGKIHF